MPQTPQSAADGGVDLFEIAGIDPTAKTATPAPTGDVDLFELGGISIDVPKSKPQGIGGYVADAITDVFKRAGGAALSGVAAVPEAAQSGIRATVRSGAGGDPATVMPGGAFIPGIDTDEAINGPMTQQQLDRRELQAERAAVGVRLPGAETLSRAGRDAQKAINDTTSQATQDAVANSQITGNLLKGEIDFGKDPSVRGFLMQGADVFGSMFPVVATALATRSPGAAGAVGGAMAAGEGVENAREFIAKQSHEQLLDTSPLYRRMIDAGAAPDEARRITSAKAEDASALLQGAVATFGDRFTGTLVTGGLDPLLARVAGRSVLGKTAAGAGLSALEEGTQELTEGVASDLGTKSVAHGKETGEDSAANFVLGALGGSAPGAARGVVAGVKDRGAKADAGGRSTVIDVTYKDAEGNTVTDVATTADAGQRDGAAAAPVQDAQASAPVAAPAAPQTEQQRVQQPDGTPESMDSTTAATRLAELEVIDSTTGLNPVQQEERAALAQRLEQDAAREADLEALGDEPQAVAAEAAAAEQAPAFDPGAVRSKTWPQFVHERGEKVATLRRGTPIWDQLQHEWAAVKTRRAGTNPEGTGAAGAPVQEIQNRDRSRPASVVQMQGMAQNPDYLRLGVSRSPESGAPMVFAVGDQADAAQALGRADVAVMSDGQRVPFRYAVMEAADVQPSNFADGAVNPLFDATHPGTVKALNNGRTAGLRAAYERGTANAYRQELAADSDMHGIDPSVIEGMQAPVLVRLYSEKDNQVNMGAKSQSQALGLSATEQAATDAALVDGGVLEVFDSGALDSAANRDFARAFIGKLQEQGQDVAGMMDANGALSPAGVTRLQAALVHKAYGDGDLVESLFGSTDNDIRAIGESLKAVAGEWANLRLAAERGAINAEVDVTENLLQAIRLVQKARRERAALHDAVQQVDMLTGDVPDALTVGMLRLLYSGHYLTRPVGRDRLVESLRAYMGAALATSASGDMFGEQVGPAAILAALSGQPVPQRQQTNDTSTDSQQAPAPQGSREPTGSDAAGERADAAGPEARRQEPDGAGRAAAGDRADGPGQEADAASGAVAPALELSSYTPEEIQAQQAQQQEAEQRLARDEAQAETQARAERERKEVAERQAASAEHFQLGQDAKDALSGQQGVFDKPASTGPARPDTAAAPAASQRPKLRDTRGTGVRLHGTSRPLPEGGPTNDGVYRGNVLNIYGQGFYTTDAADIAAGYTRKGQGGEPTLYEIAEHSPVRLYDMNAPMEPEVQSMAKRVLDDLARDENTETGERITTLAQLFDEARAESRYEGVSADELQERFDGIRYNLEDMGYRGFAHVGGGKTGNQAHKVNIYWYPEDDLSVTRSELSRFEEGAEQPAGVPFKRAESSVAPTMTADLAQELLRIAGGAAPAGVRGAPPAPMARVQKVVDEVRQAWANAPRINVVFDLQDPRVPQEARDADQLQAAEGAEGVPKGFYFDGEVYLVASQLATPEEAARVLYHEALGHHGLRGAFGEKLDAVLDQIIVARPREVRAKLQEYGELDDLAGRRYAAEEVLAEMAEMQPQLGFVRRAVAAIRAWLRTHVPALRDLAMTDTEIIRDFILPARRWVERGALAAASAPAAKPAFSLDSGAGRRALQELSELDDLFTFPKSEQTELAAIAHEHDPEIRVSKPVSIAGRQEYTLTMSGGKKAILSVRQPNPYGGEQVYDMLYTAEGMEAVTGRPGVNPEDVPPTPDVWLDVSRLDQGDSGAMAYSIASTFAHNTDSIFIGDPHGLSKTALRRRLEQMISSALKFGTTRHLAPHPDQVRGGHGVPGLRWVYGDDVGNVERMIAASVGAMDNAFPTSSQIEYDADSGSFRLSHSGKQLSRQQLAGLVGQSIERRRRVDGSAPGEAETGWRTVARTAVWRALLRRAGGQDQGGRGQRGSLLGEFAERHAQVLTDPSRSRRVFYSRGPAAGAAPPAPSTGLLSRLQGKVADLTGYRSVDDFLYTWQDKFIDLKRIQEHIKALNGTVSETNDAYRGEELYHKRVAKRTANFLRDEVRPLLKRMNEAKVAIEELERFLHARHAPEANRVMAERNPGTQQLQGQRNAAAKTVEDLRRQLQRAQARGLATGPVQKALGQALIDQDRWDRAEAFDGTEEERLSLSGMSDAEAKAIMDGYSPEQRQVLDELAARVDRINEGTLKTLESYGLMDQATLSAWRKTYQHYVPLHRDEAHPDSKAHPIGQGFSTKGDASKRRTGSNERVTNILSHVVMQREAALTRGEKNNVVKRMYLLAAQNPDKELWSLELPKKKALDPDTGLVKTMLDQGAKARDNVVTVRIGGKDRYIVFNERNEKAVRLAIAMKNLDAMELDRFTRIAAWITRWFSSVNTQYNPVFGVMNLARDLQGAMLQLSTTPLAGKQAEVFRNIRRNTRAIYKDLRRERREEGAGTSEWAKLWEQLQLDGGTTGYRDLHADPKDRAKALQKALDQVSEGKVVGSGRALLAWLSDFNETLEATTRLGVYKAALEQGISRQEAASIAKNITVNFNRKGRNTSVVGAHFAFLNAAIQGNKRMLETLAGPAGRKIMMGGVALGMASAMAGYLMMGGGDGADDEWKKIPEFVKERAIIIPLGRQDYVAIPLPLGFHVFPNIGRTIVEMGVHDDPTKSRMGHVLDMAVLALDAYNPLGGSADLGQMASPTWFDPVLALARNKDWIGREIYREDRNSNDPTPGASRVKDSTAKPYRWLASLANAATGGNEWRPGAASPTPEAIEYLVEQITGGVGREVNKAVAMTTSAFTGEELAPHQIVLAGRLYGNTRGANGQSNAYYENLKRINISESEFKARVQRGEDADAVLADVPLARAYDAAKALDKKISDLRKFRRSVQASDAPNKRDQVKAINQEIEVSMHLLNAEVHLTLEKAKTQRP